MAILEIEGWDHKQITPVRSGWVYTVPSFSQAGRFAGVGWAYRSTGAGTSTGDFTGFTATAGPLTCGAGVFMSSAVETNVNLMEFRETAISHMFVRPITTSGQIGLYRGDGTLLQSSAPAVTHPGAWDHMELKGTVHDTTGVGIVRVNGTVVINFTGDTRNGGTGVINTVRLSSGDSSDGAFYDDFYLLDSTGPAPWNDFLGDVRVSTLTPSGDGSFSQLLGSDGNSVQNYLLTQEVPPVGTTYVGSATVGQRDTYAFTDLPTASGQVLGVRPLLYAHKADAGAAAFKPVTRLAGVERIDTAIPLSPTLVTPLTGALLTVDPSNAAWTVANVNAAEFGAEVA